MNDRSEHSPASLKRSLAPDHIDLALPTGSRVRGFEIQRVISSSASTTVYLATDLALELQMAVQEYLPLQFVQRDAMWVRATDAWHEDLIARGLRAFMAESRALAHADHPALIRVHQLFEANGTAYRVMPFCPGRRLAQLRRDMVGAPDEASLRALIEGLLGALEAIHRNGGVHGGVSPSNVLLLADDRPMLLGAGAAGHEIGSDLVDSLMATLEAAAPVASPPNGADTEGTPPSGPSLDLYALADTVRFCITAEAPANPGTLRHRVPLAQVIAREFPLPSRPNYSQPLLQTLDAALSPFSEDRPLSVLQFREWLTRGVPGGALRAHAAPAPAPAPAFAHPHAPAPAGVPAPSAAPTPLPKRTATPAPPRAPVTNTNDEIDVGLEGPTSRFGHAASEPVGAWPDTAFRPAPTSAERAPWVAPPEARGDLVKRRGVQALLAVGLLGAAIALLALATGAWDQMPELSLGTGSSTSNDATTRATSPPPAIDPPAATAKPAEPATLGDALPANATAELPAAASAAMPSTAVPAPAPAPAPTPSDTATTGMAATPTPAADKIEAAAAKPAKAEVAPPTAREKAAPPANVPTRAPATMPAPAPAPAANPRAACAGRTEFALYRCMQQQCQAQRFASHPQCVLLRRDDKVE